MKLPKKSRTTKGATNAWKDTLVLQSRSKFCVSSDLHTGESNAPNMCWSKSNKANNCWQWVEKYHRQHPMPCQYDLVLSSLGFGWDAVHLIHFHSAVNITYETSVTEVRSLHLLRHTAVLEESDWLTGTFEESAVWEGTACYNKPCVMSWHPTRPVVTTGLRGKLLTRSSWGLKPNTWLYAHMETQWETEPMTQWLIS